MDFRRSPRTSENFRVFKNAPTRPTAGQSASAAPRRDRPYRRRLRCVEDVGVIVCSTLVVALLNTTLLAAAPAVSRVVVEFADGTSQKIDAPPTPPPTPPPTQPTTAPSTKPTAPARRDEPFLGINIESNRDYERQFMFIDAMKTSRRWGSAQKPYDSKAIVGPDGWPADDAGTIVITEARNISGIYKFSATGKCDLSTPGSPAKVANLVYDANRNRTYADVIVSAAPDRVTSLSLAFKNTSGGLKDIKLIRPGYADDSQIFTREFLASLKPFGAIRFMDYSRTNNSTVSKWDERCKPEDAQYIVKGAPYEHAIEIGNRTGKDIWLCVPALADDDFVVQLGKLVREKLNPELHCYIEYSNEVWNGQFKQFRQNQDAAKAEVAAGDTTLNDGGKDTNVHYWAWKRVAKRVVTFRKLLGDDPRFRVILASQVGFDPPGFVIKTQLEYVEKFHGPPSRFFYAISCAPYFSPGRDELDPQKKKWFTERDTITVDEICERLLARTQTSRNDKTLAFHTLAKKYGVKSFAYEGGLDLQQSSKNLDIKMASQYDPRAGKAIEDYLTHFYEGGGDAIFFFTLSCKYSKAGYWGLTEDVRDLSTPKYQAAVRVAEKLDAQKR